MMGCATLVFGIVSGIWSLKEFSNEGPTTKAWALAGFAIAMFVLAAISDYIESKYPTEER